MDFREQHCQSAADGVWLEPCASFLELLSIALSIYRDGQLLRAGTTPGPYASVDGRSERFESARFDAEADTPCSTQVRLGRGHELLTELDTDIRLEITRDGRFLRSIGATIASDHVVLLCVLARVLWATGLALRPVVVLRRHARSERSGDSRSGLKMSSTAPGHKIMYPFPRHSKAGTDS